MKFIREHFRSWGRLISMSITFYLLAHWFGFTDAKMWILFGLVSAVFVFSYFEGAYDERKP